MRVPWKSFVIAVVVSTRVKAIACETPSNVSDYVNGPTNRQCWGEYDINTDYYEYTPDTGRKVEYFLTVDNVTMAPDGVERPMMVFNNSFPGPVIEADWGDTVVVHVKNNLENNGQTSIHWHGVLMESNSANDGVPGVTQCPIAPGQSYTYTFRATSYGTSWYHSHFTLQYAEGLVGPLIIHGPSSANWDIDLGTVMVQDWYHTPLFEKWLPELKNMGPLPPGDNGLINGKNKLGSGGEYAEFAFVPGKKHRIRLINSSANQHFKFSIDDHVMSVQAADFVPVVPYQQTVLNIAVGQRYDLIFEAAQGVGNYWMRAVPASGCGANLNADGIRAIVRYDGADMSLEPTSDPYTPTTMQCVDEVGLKPVVPRNVGNLTSEEEFDAQYVFDNIAQFQINGSRLMVDWSEPTLLKVENEDYVYPTSYNIVSLNGSQDTWQCFVIQTTGNLSVNHAIYLHGHDFLLIAEGKGQFNKSILAGANMINPVRRDVVTLPASDPGDPVGGFIVIAFPLNNPGIWARLVIAFSDSSSSIVTLYGMLQLGSGFSSLNGSRRFVATLGLQTHGRKIA